MPLGRGRGIGSGSVRAPGNRAIHGEETNMPTFISMLSWTDQGIRSVKDTPKRVQAAREMAKKIGVEIKQIFLTSGEFDIVAVLETPNSDNIAKYSMAIGLQGNVRTRTVQAWPEAEMLKLISELA
jgi:uncharacterized protein with GYD domain